MTDPIKITSLEAENVKRVRAVQLHPSATGLTIIRREQQPGQDLAAGHNRMGARRRPLPSVHGYP